jgi:hypothetical protein
LDFLKFKLLFRVKNLKVKEKKVKFRNFLEITEKNISAKIVIEFFEGKEQ